MVRKLIILGIDGMDWDVIVRYKDKLPNLYGLMQKNNYPHLRSVFPADTTPACAESRWISTIKRILSIR